MGRFNQHLRAYQSGKELYYYNTAVVFADRDSKKREVLDPVLKGSKISDKMALSMKNM